MAAWDEVLDGTEMALNSSGTATERMEIQAESLTGKLNSLQSSWDSFVMSLGTNEIIKTVVDLLTGLVGILNTLLNDIPVLTTISHEHIAFLDIEDSIYQNLIKDIPLLKDFLVKSETYTPSYAVVRINNDIDCTSYSHPIGIIKFFDTEEMADAFCETLEELKSSECFYMVVPFLGELPKIHHTTSRAESNKKDCFLA